MSNSTSQTSSKLKKESIIKVFDKAQQKYTNVIIPSKLTIGLSADDFQSGVTIHGPIEIKNKTVPTDTTNRLYIENGTLMFNGSPAGGSTSGAVSVGWKRGSAGSNHIYATGSVSLASDTGYVDYGALGVGGGYFSSVSMEEITVAAGANDDAAISLIEETASSTGFSHANSSGYRLVYDGGASKLYIKSSLGSLVAIDAEIDLLTQVFKAYKEKTYHVYYQRSDDSKAYVPWYENTEKTSLGTTGTGLSSMFLAPHDGSIRSVDIRCQGSGLVPGSTVIALHKDGSITNLNPQTINIAAWNTTYTATFTQSFSKGDLLAVSVNPNGTPNYVTANIVFRYNERT